MTKDQARALLALMADLYLIADQPAPIVEQNGERKPEPVKVKT